MLNEKIHILIPFYNAEEWIVNCINSALNQNYKNVTIWPLNDGSSDRSPEIIAHAFKSKKNINLINHSKNNGILHNIIYGLNHIQGNKEDIIVILDGDDKFSSNDALSKVASYYSKKKAVLTYGQFLTFPENKISYSFELPEFVKNKNLYRCIYPFVFTPIRSFRYGLYKQCHINEFINEKKEFYRYSTDQALMFPLAEKSNGNIGYIDEPLYLYNRSSPINVDKIAAKEQYQCSQSVRQKPSISDQISYQSANERWNACSLNELKIMLNLEINAMKKLEIIGNSFLEKPFQIENSEVHKQIQLR